MAAPEKAGKGRRPTGLKPALPPAGRLPKVRRLASRTLRFLAYAAAILVLLPYLLVPAYMLAFVHPVSTLMVADMARGRSYERTWVNFDDMAPVLVQSVMMSEDGQFCAHGGVDWAALNLVIDDALDGEATRGASTIPMQVAKNLFLPPVRSVLRKALEIPIAMWADLFWSKRRMMEIYLNIAEWAPGVFGVEAAAQTYFGTSAAKLTRKQAALLAVTLPNPYLRNAARPSRGMTRLARIIEARAAQSGAYIKCLYD